MCNFLIFLYLVHCKQITCPPGTETCKYNSKYSADGKTAEVHYKCIASNGRFRNMIKHFEFNSKSFSH